MLRFVSSEETDAAQGGCFMFKEHANGFLKMADFLGAGMTKALLEHLKNGISVIWEVKIITMQQIWKANPTGFKDNVWDLN